MEIPAAICLQLVRSCLLDSYFLDRSFQIHFAGKLDGFDKKIKYKVERRDRKRDRNIFRFLALKVFLLFCL
jgi:hypothetical protein